MWDSSIWPFQYCNSPSISATRFPEGSYRGVSFMEDVTE